MESVSVGLQIVSYREDIESVYLYIPTGSNVLCTFYLETTYYAL